MTWSPEAVGARVLRVGGQSACRQPGPYQRSAWPVKLVMVSKSAVQQCQAEEFRGSRDRKVQLSEKWLRARAQPLIGVVVMRIC